MTKPFFLNLLATWHELFHLNEERKDIHGNGDGKFYNATKLQSELLRGFGFYPTSKK